MGTLTHNPHTYCLQRLHSAWHAVTPPVTIVLPLDANLQDLAMHLRAVAAEEYLGSQLMSLNVESVYKMFTSEFHWPKRTCELAYPWTVLQPTLCVLCACDVYVMCMCGGLTLGFNEAAAIHCGHTYLTPMTGLYVQTAIAIQTRTVNKQADLVPEGGLLSDVKST